MAKGAINVGIGVLIIGVVAVFVLFVVGFGIYSFFSGTAIPFFNFLPSFNRTVEKVEGIEILRYDIITGKVNYYDKTNWNNLEGEVFLGDKKVKQVDIKSDFESFYYGKRENNTMEIEQGFTLVSFLTLVNSHNNNLITIDKNLEDVSKFLGGLNLKIYEIYVPESIAKGYNKELDAIFERVGIDCKNCENGDIRFQLVNKETNKDFSRGSPIHFILSLGDNFAIVNADSEEKKININAKGDLLSGIFNYMKNWRDGVFKKPIGVNYMLDESGVFQYFCSEFRDKRYIFVDLSKGVDSDAKC